MSDGVLSERDAIRVIWIQLGIPLAALALGWLGALGESIAAEAGYERLGNGWVSSDADRVVAAYTIWLVVATGLLALFTLGLFIATYALFRTAAKDSANALAQTRELFRAERRPWIAVDLLFDVAEVLDELNARENLIIHLRATNTGLSPALNVFSFVQSSGLVPNFDADGYAKLSQAIEHRISVPAFAGVAIFPGREEIVVERQAVSLHTLPEIWRNAEDVVFGAVLPGFVFYESPHEIAGAREKHATPVAFHFHITRRAGAYVGVEAATRSAPSPTEDVRNFV